MKTRKGPFGHFATTMVDKTDNIYEYAMEIVESGQIEGLLPLFSDEKRNGIELSFDYSGLTSINEYINTSANSNLRRNAVRDLFNLFSTLLNNLLPLDNLVFDTNYVFFNEESKKLSFCYTPYKSDKNLELSSIGTKRFEELLNHDFFKTCLNSDEITTITYALKNNDENLLKEVLNKSNENGENKKTIDSTRLGFQLLLILSSLCSAFVLIIGSKELGLFLAFISLCLLIKVSFDNKKNQNTDEESELKSKRTEILFENRSNELIDVNDLFSYACLEEISDNKDPQKIGLYSKETTIGSDRFISDIHLDDKKISDLQAKIIHEDNSYWIIDLSQRNNTYLENRALTPKTKYEIKNGQIIRFGESDFIFKIGL